jgi:DNA-binding winged helix-turn-helix (wHTH) protein
MAKIFIISKETLWQEILSQNPRIAELLLEPEAINSSDYFSHIIIAPDSIGDFPIAITQKNPHLQYCLLVEKNRENEISQLPFTPQQKIFLPCHISEIFKKLEFFISAAQPRKLYFAEWNLDTDRRIFQNNKTKISISEAENALLSCLIANSEKGISRESLLKEIFGYHKDSSTHTLETHIYRLRQKLQISESSPLIITTEDGYIIKTNIK